MAENYFMSKEFEAHAAKAVTEAIAKANALGLPRAYNDMKKLPEVPVVVTITGARKKRSPLLPPERL